jgi:orotidine-5'-phosphate decarboxylase
MFRDVILRSANSRKTRLVLALDLTLEVKRRLDVSLKLLEEVSESVAAVKLNYHLLLPYGLYGISRLVNLCNEKELPLIADLKLNDVGSTNTEVYRLLKNSGINCLIANPIVGFEEGIDVLLKDDRGDFGVLLIVFTSNNGSKETYELDVGDQKLYRVFAKRAKKWGADGVVVSAKRTDVIREVREILGERLLIFSPGVGIQGGSPSAAVAAGADFVIVGRSIVESNRPVKVIDELNLQLKRI